MVSSAAPGSSPASSSARAHGHQVGRVAGHQPALALVGQVLGPGLHGHLEHPLLVVGARHGDDPLALELPADRPRLGHGATVLGEEVADLRPGAVAVVGQALDDHRHAGRGRSPRRRSDSYRTPSSSPDPRLMARSMVSMGTEASRALVYMVRRLALAVMSLPPSRAATSIWRMSLANTLARAASLAPFWCLVVAHLECPDMR